MKGGVNLLDILETGELGDRLMPSKLMADHFHLFTNK